MKVQVLKSLEDEKQVAGDEKREKEKIHLEKIVSVIKHCSVLRAHSAFLWFAYVYVFTYVPVGPESKNV